MKVALIHDWLTGMRGGERCLEGLCAIFPEADLFTLLHNPGSVSPLIEDRRIFTSALVGLPGFRRHYRYYLPLMPSAIEAFDLGDYDLVVSSSHCVAKGVLPRPDALHIAYLHTPMRYAWDQWPQYARTMHPLMRAIASPVLSSLRSWDVASSPRVNRFVANSGFVAQRIQRYYGRTATVVHPPVRTAYFDLERTPGDQYLIVSAMVPYKRLDLAIATFNRLKRPLKIVGDGPMLATLRAQAGPHISFTGWLPDEALRECYSTCRALVQTATEDFGIVSVEAQAAGVPVLALGRAGALDTVLPLQTSPNLVGTQRPTGVFFDEQTPESLEQAVRRFEHNEEIFDPARIRAHARQFDEAVFETRMREVIDESLRSGTLLAEKRRSSTWNRRNKM
jgi:glycosyltransferase involved in cell wall biosynthesis